MKPSGWDELVEKIEGQLANLSPLGPRLDDAKSFERIEKVLFDGSRKRAVTHGSEIHWRPYRNLRGEISALLLAGDDGSSLVRQLNELFSSIKNLSYDLEQIYHRDHGFQRVQPAWVRDMQSDCDRINKQINAAEIQAMGEGRVILSDAKGHLLPPSTVRHPNAGGFDQFILSREIPRSQILSAGERRLIEKNAGKAMVQIVLHFHAEGRRVTREQLYEVVEDRFSLAHSAAERVYENVKEPLPMKPSKRKKREMVSLKEIKDFVLTGGVNTSPPDR